MNPNPNVPPPSLLDALRRPRRVQLGDPCVKALLAQWKKRGRPIEYADLREVVAINHLGANVDVLEPLALASARGEPTVRRAMDDACIHPDAGHRYPQQCQLRDAVPHIIVRLL